MIINGIVNRDLNRLLGEQGHKDRFMLCDAGMAIPKDAKCVDLSYAKFKPMVTEVLAEIQKYFEIESVAILKETKENSPERFREFLGMLKKEQIEMTDIVTVRKEANDMKFFIRTGDYTPFSNLVITSGASIGWGKKE